MLKKIGTLKVDTLRDIHDEQINALKKAGFTVLLISSSYGEDIYDIGKQYNDEF